LSSEVSYGYDHLTFEERCYEYDKAEYYQIIILKRKFTLNQIRIHNEGSEKGKAIRSLLSEVKCSEIISMEVLAFLSVTTKNRP